jgi:imidazoleglycerol-phosphate dehydratase
MITVKRESTESVIRVTLDGPPVKADYRSAIRTPIPFLNHMLEHIVWRSGLNLGVDVTLDKFDLTHVVCEDAGMTVGKAVLRYAELCRERGAAGYGDGVGIIDEASAAAAVSFESRALFVFDADVAIPALTENTCSEDLTTFLDGFTQGAGCTLHVHVRRGANGHHIWEAVYRAVGTALGRAFAPDGSRAGMTSGVAGKINYTLE